MHFRKRILTYILCILSVFTVLTQQVHAKDTNVPYVISKYNIQMQIHDNGVAQISEQLDVSNCENLMVSKIIPVSFKMDAKDAPYDYEQTYTVSKIAVVNHEFTVEQEEDKTIVNIVLPKKTDSIQISYEINLKDFLMENQQLFYYTLFTGFEGSILSLQAEITFPEAFDANFQMLNAEGKLVSDYRTDFNNKKLTITSDRSILFGSHLSVRTVLPPNYFTYSNPMDIQLAAALLSIFLVCSIFIIYMSKEKGNRKKRYLSHPPRDIPMILYGYIVDGYISEKDFFPLLVEWANHGYISIEETAHDVKIILRKELPVRVPEYERLFFDALFGNKTVVNLYDLENKDFSLLFEEMKEIVYDTYCSGTKNSIYHMNNVYYQMICCALAGVPMLLCMMAAFYTETYSFISALFPALFSWLIIALSCIPWVILVKKFPILTKKARKSMFSMIGVIQGVVLFGCGYVMLYHHMNFLYIILCVLMTIFFMLILFVLDRRTKTGSRMYKQVIALDNFIRQSRVAQIDDLMYREPNYYYLILPYVFALDVVQIWSGKFTALMIKKPFWFLTPQTPSQSMYWVEPLVYALDDLSMAILKHPSQSKNY